MKFECGDLERALAVSDLMPEAREHLKTCADCRREYRLWTEISSSARELHQEWESADLWPKIRQAIQAETKPAAPWWRESKIWALAAVVVAAVLLPLRLWHAPVQPQASPTAQTSAKTSRTDRDFLTDQALREVEKNEAAYRQSIDKLSRLAQPELATAASPSVVNAKEKLLLLDSAIADTRANVTSNRFNVHLQNTLADLYREKQQTLQELLARDRKN
jgi:predicted anti-sigma-YlaC factor YlaD